MAGTKIADFFADIKIQGDTLTLKNMVNSMADMKLETLGEIGALGALGMALKNAGLEAMRLSSGYTAINKEYGTNIQMLQRWQNVARGSNVPVEAVTQTFTKMQKLLADPLIGNPNSGFMRAAGLLNIQGANRMTAEQLNESLRVAVPAYIKRMTPFQGRENAITNAGSLIESLGASRDMMQMYTLSNSVFQRREFNSPIKSDADIRRWTELSEQIEVTKHNFFMLTSGILEEALPGLLAFSKTMMELTVAIEGFLGKNFTKAKEAAAAPWGAGQPGGPTNSDVMAHAAMSWLIPDIVKGFSDRQVSVVQNNKTDIHVNGGETHGIAEATRRAQERVQQHQITHTAQALSGQVDR